MTSINNLVAKHSKECAEQINEARASVHDKRVVFMLVENAMFRFYADASAAENQRGEDLLRKLQMRAVKK